MIQLPNELISQILEDLWDDTNTLMSCVGTCRRLRKLAHRVLYADVTIDLNGCDARNCGRIRRISLVLSLALPHMRVLRIELGIMDLATHILARLLFRWIGGRAALKELYLRGHLERLRGQIVLPILMVPSLQVLSLVECTNIPIAVFQNRPTLRSLRLRYSSISAPFNFSDFYSTEAIYGFSNDTPSDDHGIRFPRSLHLALGLSDNPRGDCVLLRRSGLHLTTLNLFFRSVMPEDYGSFTGISLDVFPALSSLSMLFEVAVDIKTPIDVLAFLYGQTRRSSITYLRLGFNFDSPFFDDLADSVPYIMASPRPFDIAQVFDRTVHPYLETGCCVLQLSVRDIRHADQEAVGVLVHEANNLLASLFPRTLGLEWVHLAVEVNEPPEDDIYTSY